jgi:hypothetical protein
LTVTDTADLELKRVHKKISSLDDEMLVFAMWGMLSDGGSTRSFLVGGQTEQLALHTRVLLHEIACRWIPSDVLAPALVDFFKDFEEDDEDETSGRTRPEEPLGVRPSS